MSPITHLLASWVVAAKTTDNDRDARLVTLAGILPDTDGLGLAVDIVTSAMNWKETDLYHHFHHFLFHGALGAVLAVLGLVIFARRRCRVALLVLGVFHLHLLCDLVGSRGPAPEDLWPIFYLGPFSKEPMWIWKGQWALDAWPNQLITIILAAWVVKLAVQRGDSVVGVFHCGADAVFVRILRRWRVAIRDRFRGDVPDLK
jgi:hypothetical protein